MSRARQVTLLSAILMTMLLAEGGCWLFFTVIARDKFILFDPAKFIASTKEIAIPAENFDSELGWKLAPPKVDLLGARPSAFPADGAFLSVFGGSWAQDGEVSDKEAWPEELSARLGKRVLNFGVPAYGIDQSVLMLQRQLKKIATPYVMLAVTVDNFPDSLSVYNKFYFPSYEARTKPRFKSEDGGLRFIPNPIQRWEDRARLSDSAFVAEMGKRDGWSNLRNFPTLGFPYTAILFHRGFWSQIQFGGHLEINENTPAVNDSAYRNAEIMDTVLPEVQMFIDAAVAGGVHPIITLLPSRWETKMVVGSASRDVSRPTQSLRSECVKRHWPCLIAIDEIDKVFPGDWEGYYEPHGHLSPKGSSAIADWLKIRLRQIDPAIFGP